MIASTQPRERAEANRPSRISEVQGRRTLTCVQAYLVLYVSVCLGLSTMAVAAALAM